MKFSDGVDGLTKENKFLHTLTKFLLIIVAGELGLSLALYNKEPIIVERSIRGLEVVKQLAFARDESDIRQAIRLMIQARFNSDTISPEIFLNPKQLVLREMEQKDLKSRSMTQAVIVRTVKITKEAAIIDMDRMISVGELRSALKAKIKISFEETSPTDLNPYGLTLSLAEPLEQKEERK